VTFIVLEGGEGSGKSTQTKKLGEHLRARGCVVRTTFEPGDTSRGKELRDRLLHGGALTADQELELMLEDRRLHVDEVIQPALARGEVVVCDRFADSTLVYQGAGRGLDMQALASVISFATAGLQPDMTVLLDLPVEVGLARKHTQQAGWNRFEAEAQAFHGRVRDGYRTLAHGDPRRWHCFDGVRPVDELAEEIWRAVAARLGLT
jgi:dTMP kinase